MRRYFVSILLIAEAGIVVLGVVGHHITESLLAANWLTTLALLLYVATYWPARRR